MHHGLQKKKAGTMAWLHTRFSVRTDAVMPIAVFLAKAVPSFHYRTFASCNAVVVRHSVGGINGIQATPAIAAPKLITRTNMTTSRRGTAQQLRHGVTQTNNSVTPKRQQQSSNPLYPMRISSLAAIEARVVLDRIRRDP
jgi:hypothetical protein